ncbi:adenylate/guanylate cyclase domain-containing protein [Leptospira sarikeiensis]|uniref:Adenylate/guanylate cyclase domain-containing protein n=1 Tax=Leptospira sarikeiensis TaxID=2484943 RepID=A0A4R9KDN7_9LEPT|nr:adenylate/guanylate cyclase domain-containing protein [Leptospira sarikeiensis]TGL64266.1 adenylate/guanylate cyclase domain-containing protein [Leptospira sarikeiensis]
MISRFNRFIDWVQLTGLTQGLSDQEIRAIRTTGSTQFIIFIIPTFLAIPIYFTEPPETHLYSYSMLTTFLIALGFARYLLTKRRQTAAAVMTLVALNFEFTVLAVAQADDPAPLGFLVSSILPFLMILRTRTKTLWSLVILPVLFFLAFQYYYRVFGGSAIFGPPRWIVPADYLMPPLVLLVIAMISIIYQFVKAVNKAEDKLSQEHAQSEKLLLNILPREVADELKQNGISKPRHFPSATVCFTDFEGFTKISESLGPSELVAELDRCFSYFDSLMDRYKLEKLKTIGDSYMFVGGIPNSSSTHAVDCVLAALEIQAFMNQMKEIKTSQNLPYWQLRLGIHSGDLVAGVIGEKKFAYDVWSDTVNTASRCESSGATGKINISGATYALVKDFFDCEYRGQIAAKHKGNIDMYFVQGLLPELHRAGEPRVPNSEFEKRYSALLSNMEKVKIENAG